MIRNAIVVVAGILFLHGCAAPGKSSSHYMQPKADLIIDNEAVLDDEFEAVWDRLVRNLSSSFFVINNIDKESRLLNVSFSSSDPRDYVDCGMTKRQFNYRNESQAYEYPVASDSFFKWTGTWGAMNNLPAVYDISRDASVEGRINVYVAPVEGNRTRVAANARYLLKINVTGIAHGFNAFGAPAGSQHMQPSSVQASFNTKETVRENWGNAAQPDWVTCRATGELETRILKLATAH